MRLHGWLALAVTLVAVAGWSDARGTALAASGLVNPSFEDGVLEGLPSSWAASAPEAGGVKVVDAEGPSDFPTYADMGNITVVPYAGANMLRLGGAPRRVAQSQARGPYTASQSFVPQDDALSFAFRLFSWEFRGSDAFSFSLTGAAGSAGALAAPVVVTIGGQQVSCTALPCTMNIDTGSNGDFVDSGWTVVDIIDIPQGSPLNITYAVAPAGSESHATWVYLDSGEIANQTPVAAFSINPSEPAEGETVQFQDLSFDPDTADGIVGWAWEVDGQVLNAQHPLYLFPDDGVYPVQLTVESSDGTTATTALTVNVGNLPPLINALNVEALAGEEAPIVTRFIDPAWLDTHTAELTVGGSPVPDALLEDNNPAYASGIVEGTASSMTSTSGLAEVEDDDGGIGDDPFTFTIVPEELDLHEGPDDTLVGVPVLASDGSYLSYIQSPGDVDLFEVQLPGGRALPPGSEVLVTLRDLPADYDLVLLTLSPDGSVDPGDSGVASFNTAPYQRSPYQRSPYQRSPYQRSPYQRSPYQRSSFSFDQLPLSQLAFTGLEGDEIIGTDIGLGELGLSLIEAANVRIAGFSASRGIDVEAALGRTSASSSRMFIAVVGANGEFAATPYRLQVEASPPLDLTGLLGTEACSGTPLVGPGQSTSAVTMLFDGAGAARTLFVTQRERMRAAHAMDDASWDALLASLVVLAEHPLVDGDIISLPSTIYDAWDQDPCNVDAANAVAAQIAAIVGPQLASLDYVVFVGDDGIVPFRREPDDTAISNERAYAIDSFMEPGSPLYASIALGYNLTDDYYVDVDPIAWQGRKLYVPDLPIGRLVETPDEISGAAAAFLASEGQLNPTTGFVSGYDFFTDGSQDMSTTLSESLATTDLINNAWTSDDLRCRFLGIPVPGMSGCSAQDVSVPNAHFTHYAALSASGFNNVTLDEFLASDQVPGSPLVAGALAFSMGCHAGFSAPDRDALPPDLGLDVDPALDFAQAMAQQQAIWVASTGFGLGDTIGLGGTEQLMALFAEDLTTGSVSAGAALVSAKQSYINGLSAMTVYDEKSSIQTTLYGLPMYQVNVPVVAPVSAGSLAPTDVPSGLTLTMVDGGTTNSTIPYSETSTADGTVIAADGLVSSTAARPVQPRVVFEDSVPPSLVPIHSAIVYGGAYLDLPDFDPAITRPTTEWEENALEPTACLRSFWPAELTEVNSLTTVDALAQSVVLTPAQFRCNSDVGAAVQGLERLYTALTVELLRCESDDFVPPVVHSVDLLMIGDSTVRATIDASDGSGIARIIALRFGGGVITPTFLDVEGSSPFDVDVPDVGPDDLMVFLVQDGACNVTWATGKGAKLKTMLIDAGPDVAYVPDESMQFETTVFNYAQLVAPLYYEWQFGDGSFKSGTLLPGDLTPDGVGGVTFEVAHTFTGVQTGEAKVTVLDAGGGIAQDGVGFACDDTSDADFDLLSACDEALLGTDPHDPDTDRDACRDGYEINITTDPLDPWDFFSVPIPALFSLADPTGVVADEVVTPQDAQAVFAVAGEDAVAGAPLYEQDLNGNGVKDGWEYDRSILGAFEAGPPDGMITAQDAQLAFAQSRLGYNCSTPS